MVGATRDTFTYVAYFNHDSVSCLVTSNGTCGGHSTSAYIIIELTDVGVHSVNAQHADIVMVPNPNKGTFTVKGFLGNNTNENVQLEVVNMLGQTVYTAAAQTQNGNINERVTLGNNLAAGIYLLNLRSADNNEVIHFVIEK